MSVRHGPRSRTVLSIGSLAVTTRERKGRVPARRVRRVWCPCLADVHCLFGVQGGWPKGTETGHPSGQNPGSQGLFSQARLSLLLKRKVNRTAGGSLQSGTACLGTETGPGWFSVLFLRQRTCFREGSHHSRGGGWNSRVIGREVGAPRRRVVSWRVSLRLGRGMRVRRTRSPCDNAAVTRRCPVPAAQPSVEAPRP